MLITIKHTVNKIAASFPGYATDIHTSYLDLHTWCVSTNNTISSQIIVTNVCAVGPKQTFSFYLKTLTTCKYHPCEYFSYCLILLLNHFC